MNIECAVMELRAHFISIYFSDMVETEPDGDFPKDKPFINQVAIGYTDYEAEELIALFKEIEQLFGRSAENDKNHLIPIDIDLLLWNGQTLKPEDMRRKYVMDSVRLLVSRGI